MSVDAPDWLERLSFECLDGSHFEWRPDPDTPEASIRDLAEAIAREYVERHRARQRAEEARPAKDDAGSRPIRQHLDVPVALKWLKPVCYNAILTCLHWEMFEELEARSVAFGRLARGPRKGRSLFMRGLMGIFAHTFPPEGVEVRATNAGKPFVFAHEKGRKRIVEDMELAFRHYVEPLEFNAFFHQNRAALRQLESDADLLNGYLDQVARRRAEFIMMSSSLQDHRELLPTKIKLLADAYHDALEAALDAERRKQRKLEGEDDSFEAEHDPSSNEDDGEDWCRW